MFTGASADPIGQIQADEDWWYSVASFETVLHVVLPFIE